MNRRKSIFNWNHISKNIDEVDIIELKSYYQTYHKKFWAYKKAMKRLKNIKLAGNIASVFFASGGIVSAAVTGVALVAVSSGAIIIQIYMTHKNFGIKIEMCKYAYQAYNHILIQIKEALRSGKYNKESLIQSMTSTDSFITDVAPPVDKFYKKYNERFNIDE